MKLYVSTITGYQPYPVSKEYVVKANDYSVASNRSIKLFRKEFPSRRLEKMSVNLKKV